MLYQIEFNRGYAFLARIEILEPECTTTEPTVSMKSTYINLNCISNLKLIASSCVGYTRSLSIRICDTVLLSEGRSRRGYREIDPGILKLKASHHTEHARLDSRNLMDTWTNLFFQLP